MFTMEFIPAMRLVENGQKIEAACFVDGNDDEFVIEFHACSNERVVRSVYDRRTTATKFFGVLGEERLRLLAMGKAAAKDRMA